MDDRQIERAAERLGVDTDQLADKLAADPAFAACVNGLDDPNQLPPIDGIDGLGEVDE